MGKRRPKHGTLAWLESLSKRDFDNGATLDEIAKVYEQRDALLMACKHVGCIGGHACCNETPCRVCAAIAMTEE